MNTDKTKTDAASAKQVALAELSQPTQKAISDPRKHPMVKAFRLLSDAERADLAAHAATELHRRFHEGQRIDVIFYLICCCVASERHWDTAHRFLECILEQSGDPNLFREIALSLLEISDSEISGPSSRLPLAETALVLLTEYGLMLANQEGRSSLDHKGASHVVEYISTSLLARSNVNSTAMRISLIHFLTRCKPEKQSTIQLHRVISRFGNTLLEDLLRAFFDDKKKVNAAFFFLVEHLHAFLSASPSLATMTHDVLKHHMLKYPAEFPSFLASYCEWAPKDRESLTLAMRHIALLYKSALDVNQRPLSEAMSRVLIKVLEDIRGNDPEALAEHLTMTLNLIGAGQATTPNRQMMLQDVVLELQALGGDLRAAQRVISMSRAKRSKDQMLKPAKVGDKPSPLESMLQLAS
jgi:hypothetical protein